MKALECILLIDDSEMENFYNRIVIEGCGAAEKIRVAENGLEGIDYLLNRGKFKDVDQNPTPQLILLDINMPKMNGFEFLEEYNKLPPQLRANHCIMMLTTSINSTDKEKAQNFDVLTGFWNKPLHKDSLIDLIERKFSKIA